MHAAQGYFGTVCLAETNADSRPYRYDAHGSDSADSSKAGTSWLQPRNFFHPRSDRFGFGKLNTFELSANSRFKFTFLQNSSLVQRLNNPFTTGSTQCHPGEHLGSDFFNFTDSKQQNAHQQVGCCKKTERNHLHGIISNVIQASVKHETLRITELRHLSIAWSRSYQQKFISRIKIITEMLLVYKCHQMFEAEPSFIVD